MAGARAGDHDLAHDVNVRGRRFPSGSGGRDARVSIARSGHGAILTDRRHRRIIGAPREVRSGTQHIALIVSVIRVQRVPLIQADADARLHESH